MYRTTKISTVKVTAVDILAEKFVSFTVKVSDLGKTESINRKKVSDAVKAVDSWKDSYILGKWEIEETVDQLRYMSDEDWIKYSTIVTKPDTDTDTEPEKIEV